MSEAPRCTRGGDYTRNPSVIDLGSISNCSFWPRELKITSHRYGPAKLKGTFTVYGGRKRVARTRWRRGRPPPPPTISTIPGLAIRSTTGGGGIKIGPGGAIGHGDLDRLCNTCLLRVNWGRWLQIGRIRNSLPSGPGAQLSHFSSFHFINAFAFHFCVFHPQWPSRRLP